MKRDRLAAEPYEAITVGDHQVRFLVHTAESHGALSVFEATFPPGTGVPSAHSHAAFDETFYGVQGDLTFTVADETLSLKPGEAIFVPRGETHGFFNHGTSVATFLAIASPGPPGAESYIRDLAAIFAAAGDSAPDRGLLDAAMRRHDYVPAHEPA